MAFPSVTSITETSFSSSTNEHLVSMPATVDAGDLLLILTCIRDDALTTPTGWTQQWSTGNNDRMGVRCYVKDADGTEGGTTVDVVSTEDAGEGAAQVYRISASSWLGTLGTDVESGTDVTATSNIPDPPSLTPTWGAEDTLWIAMCAATDDDATVNTYPTSYGNGVDTVSGGGTNAGAMVGSARRELNATSDNPDTFTLSEDEAWSANIVAIRPAAAAALDFSAIGQLRQSGGMIGQSWL